MPKAVVCVHLDYPDAFDFEDLRTLFHAVMSDAQARGKLDLPADLNDGVEVKCAGIGRICPDWRN
jgi:hypothetical protein